MSMRGWKVCLAIAMVCATTLGDTKPRAARSVHLWYQAEPGTLFYNEVSVDESTPDSYFCACGFSHGYFGIQELNEGKKIALFSVWDPEGGNDPKAVATEKRVETLEQGEGVQIGRFGGEGTGGQCKLPIEWKIKQTVKFCITAKVSADKTKTAYTGWLFRPDQQRWQLMATFQTLSKGEALTGYYSFVEDFRRDGKSPDERRSARYCNGWVRTAKGEWISLTRAVFDADATPLDNVNAEPVEDGFLLQTGGDIVQKNKLQTMLTRQPTGVNLPAKASVPNG
jgi:hypothetical protein